MFFEPLPADEATSAATLPESPPWSGPPAPETGGGAGRRHARPGEVGLSRFGLWLWPLPPAEAFQFAVEWPLGGIELTIAELDGAAIATAATGSAYYWPETWQAPESDR